MDVSEHLRRELVYSLNAALLRTDAPADAEQLTRVLLAILRFEGPRHHEPDLLGAWAEALAVEPAELESELEEAVDIILDELRDDEASWSAHRLLDLLALEPFWVLTWSAAGEPRPAIPSKARGIPLPLALRVGMVRILDALELEVFEAHQAQRSVHDPVPKRVLQRALDVAMASIAALARSYRRRGVPPDLSTALVRADNALPTLRDALAEIQHWKLAEDFDPAPDADDGEWTMRVLERLYGLEWVVQTDV